MQLLPLTNISSLSILAFYFTRATVSYSTTDNRGGQRNRWFGQKALSPEHEKGLATKRHKSFLFLCLFVANPFLCPSLTAPKPPAIVTQEGISHKKEIGRAHV